MRRRSWFPCILLVAAGLPGAPASAQTPGSTDTSFNGGQGYFAAHASSGGLERDALSDLEVLSDGRVMMPGSAENVSGESETLAWFLQSNGVADLSLTQNQLAGADGFCSPDDPTWQAWFHAAAVAPDGKIVFAGTRRYLASDNEWMIVRTSDTCAFDTGWGGAGRVYDDAAHMVDGDDQATAVAVLDDGRVVVAGWQQFAATDYDFRVDLFLPNGARDPSFNPPYGYRGIAFDLPNGGDDRAWAMAIQPDGKILVGGQVKVDNGDRDFALVRLNLDGTLDASFGGGGKVRLDFAGVGQRADDELFDVAVQRDGRILVAGATKTPTSTGQDFVVARLRLDGTFDPSFAGTGWRQFDFALGGTGDEVVRKVLVEPSGSILLAGDADRPGSDRDLVLYRLRLDGTTDTGFGLLGLRVIAPDLCSGDPNCRDTELLAGVGLQENGRKVVVGAVANVNPTLRQDAYATRVFNGPQIFVDDFEGGNALRWSAQTP